MKTYEVIARSNDGHNYQCLLTCVKEKLDEALEQHMIDLKWSHYGYKIERFKEYKVQDHGN